VLDLGCGYGEFINNITARRRIGLDMWDGISQHLDPGVEPIVSSVTQLDGIEDGSVRLCLREQPVRTYRAAGFHQVLDALRTK
jgi:hypothetical protein